MQSRVINIRNEDAAMYPMFAMWWVAHKWGAVPAETLSPCAVVVEDEGNALAAAWLYLANGVGLAWMEWTVTNPANTPMQSVRALRLLVADIKTVAKSLNYGFVLTTCRQDSLVKTLERAGFEKTDSNVTHLLMSTGLQA